MSDAGRYVVEGITALLLVAGGLLSLVASLGFVRLRDYFQRMHPPALATTLGAWCVCLASVIFLSMVEGMPVMIASTFHPRLRDGPSRRSATASPRRR